MEKLTNLDSDPHCPPTKEYKSKYDSRILRERREIKIGELLPHQSYRISYLKNPEEQLKELFDYFQSMGIPMGADNWVDFVIARLDLLQNYSKAAKTLLHNSFDESQENAVQRFKEGVEHYNKMFHKLRPKTEQKCDWCGWPGAELVGNGYAACQECIDYGNNLEKNKEDE